MTPLRKLVQTYNDKLRSSAELVPWFNLASPGLVLNFDGSLLAGFEYSGPQVESSNSDEQETLIESMEIAMRSIDDRNVLWSFLDKRRRRYAEPSRIQNPVARYVDDHWRLAIDHGQLSCVRHVLFISFQPFRGQGGFFEEIVSRVRQEEVGYGKAIGLVLKDRMQRRAVIARMEGQLGTAIHAFENQLKSFGATLGGRLRLKRFEGQSLLCELSNRINMASPRSSILLPPNSLYFLNTLLPTDHLYRESGGLLRFQGSGSQRWISMHSVKGYPGFANNQVVESLLSIPSEFTLAQMYRPMDQEKAKTFIADQHQHYINNVKSPLVQAMEKLTKEESTRVNPGMQALAEDAHEAQVLATRDNVGFGHYSMALQVISASREGQEEAGNPIYSVLQNAGYGLVREDLGVGSAFSLTLPGAADAVLRTSIVSTGNLADMTVLRTVSAGNPRNEHLSEQTKTPQEALVLLPSTNDIPQFFDLHVGDVGHFMVIGAIGAGKTTFINFLIMNWQRYAPCKVITLDRDYSNYITLKSLGGSYVNLNPDLPGSARMSPLRWLSKPANHHRLRSWLELALTAFDAQKLTEPQITVLDNAIAMLHAQPLGEKSLSALHSFVNGQDRDLGNRFRPWIVGGRYGSIFDHEVDDFALADICGIEIGQLLKDENLAPAVLGYLFEVIDESVDSTRPTLIYLEEAWYLLKNPVFAARFEDWIKTMRKRNACVGLATQSLKDVTLTGISDTLNDNIKTRIMLPNSQARANLDVYVNMLNMTVEDVDIIRTAREKGQYYLVAKDQRRLVDVVLPPAILNLTRSDAMAKECFNRHLKKNGERWLADYLEEINAS